MTAPTEWRTLPVTEFPALVQFQSSQCHIYNGHFYGNEELAVRWQPWTHPPLPKKNAFEEWMDKQGLDKSANYSGLYRSCYDHSIAAERARFAEGVTALIKK